MAGGEKSKTDVLIFVEDPGAVNGVIDLPEALKARGVRAQILAAGHAVEYLDSLGGDFQQPDPDAEAETILDQWTPKLVLAGTAENPDTLGLKLFAEARKRGLASVGFADGPASAEFRFRGPGDTPLAFAPEWILAPDEVTRQRFEALGHPAANVVDCGHPYFDRVRAMGQELAARGRENVRAEAFPDAPGDRVVVVFLAEISDGMAPGEFERGPDYTLHGRGASDKRTDIVLEEVLDALALTEPRPYFVVRPHPKNTTADFAPYVDEIDSLSRSGPATDMVFAADLVVGMTTILLFEAAVMGRPTLSVTPRAAESEWLTSIGLGLTAGVHTREELRQTLAAAVADPARVMGKSPDQVISFGAVDRIGDFLAGLLNGPQGKT